VKFQLYRAKDLYVKNAGYADYLGKKKSIYDIIEEMEVPYDWLPKLIKYCNKKDIIFLCTPFDEASVDQLEKNNVQAYKIASYSITHLPLIRHIAKKGKPIIFSTGASNMTEIRKAVETIKETGNDRIAMMECTAKYPAPLSSMNLKVIPMLINIFKVPVGLSDHSRDPLIAPLGAVALGAKLIEKHFTTDNTLPGPDQEFAILGDELKKMVSSVRKLEEALGEEKKEILNEEKELHDFARRYIYANKNIKKGKTFTKNNLIILRSGNKKKGLEPSRYYEILGKKASLDIKKGDPLTERCISHGS
jgi:N-acetylneuraminate synthase